MVKILHLVEAELAAARIGIQLQRNFWQLALLTIKSLIRSQKQLSYTLGSAITLLNISIILSLNRFFSCSMALITPDSTTKIVLADSSKWEDWNERFIAKAILYKL